MRSFFILIFISLTTVANSQKRDTVSSFKNVQVFLENYQNTDKIPKCYFEKDFRLKLLDSTVTIVEFLFVWQNDGDCFPEEFLNKSEKVVIDKREWTQRLKYIKVDATVVIDEIKVLKDNVMFKLPSICYYVFDNGDNFWY